MQLLSKTRTVIILAVALGIAVVILTALFFPRAASYGPADVLPADRTLLYLENADPSVPAQLGFLVPVLHTMPPTDGTAAALIRHDDGSAHWVVFEKDETGAAAMRAVHPGTLALIGTGASLSDDAAYRTLARGRAGTGSWLYVHAAQDHLALPDALEPPGGPLSIALPSSGIHIAWPAAGMVRPLSAAFGSTDDQRTILHLQAGDLRSLLGQLSGMLTDHTTLAYESALRAWFARTFGQDLSLVYDLAPLLEGQTSVTLMQTNSGTLALLEGTADNAARQLDALHAGFAASLGTAQRVERTFDDAFSIRHVRAGSDARESTDEVSGWHLRSATRGDSGLHSAVRGDRFMLSNDISLLRAALETPAVPPPAASGMPVARGTLHDEAARGLLQTALPGEALPVPADLLSAPLLHWELVRSGNLTVLRVY